MLSAKPPTSSCPNFKRKSCVNIIPVCLSIYSIFAPECWPFLTYPCLSWTYYLCNQVFYITKPIFIDDYTDSYFIDFTYRLMFPVDHSSYSRHYPRFLRRSQQRKLPIFCLLLYFALAYRPMADRRNRHNDNLLRRHPENDRYKNYIHNRE